jgi:hypothetical protein
MLNTKCGYCGTVAQLADQICVACGGDLTRQSSFPPFSSFDRQDPAQEWKPLVDPDQPIQGVGAFSIENALGDTLSLFFRNLWLITKIVVVIVAPFEIMTALNAVSISTQWEVTTWSYLLGAACKVLVAPALIYSLLKLLQTGNPGGIHESYRWGLSKLIKLSICALISTVLQGLGYALCIIPGIIVTLSFAVVYPVAVLEEGSVNEIFSRSVALTRGHRLEMFVVYLLLGILTIIVAAVAGFVIGAAGLFPVTIVASIASDVFEQLFTVLSLVLYLSLSRMPETGNYTVLSLNK